MNCWSSDVCSSDLGLRRHLPPGHAAAGGGDDAIDHRIVDPGSESRDDRGDVVLHDRTIRKRVPGSLDPCGQNITRTIVRRGACVGYGENRDPDWEERGCFVTRHWRSSSRAACRPYGSRWNPASPENRSEKRPVGKECVSTVKSRGAPYH